MISKATDSQLHMKRDFIKDTVHNAYIEQLDSSVYKIEPYIILSYLL